MTPELLHAVDWLRKRTRTDAEVARVVRAVCARRACEGLGELAENYPDDVIGLADGLGDMVEQISDAPVHMTRVADDA